MSSVLTTFTGHCEVSSSKSGEFQSVWLNTRLYTRGGEGTAVMCSEAWNSRPVEVIERGSYGHRECQRQVCQCLFIKTGVLGQVRQSDESGHVLL